MKLVLLFALTAIAAVSAANVTVIDLLFDISESIDPNEFALMKGGFKNAICNGNIIPLDGTVAVGVVEWSRANLQNSLHPITLISAQSDLDDVAAAIDGWTTTPVGGTAPGSAIAYAHNRIQSFVSANSNLVVGRKIIDIASDGVENEGADTITTVQTAAADGVQTNCLAIQDAWTASQICGDKITSQQTNGAFMVVADGFSDFLEAIQKKIIAEVTDDPPPQDCETADCLKRNCQNGYQSASASSSTASPRAAKICWNNGCPKEEEL